MECQTCVHAPAFRDGDARPHMCCVLVQSLERRDIRMLTSSRLWLIVGDIQALQRKVLAVTMPMIMITVSASSDACIDAFKCTWIIFVLNLRVQLYRHHQELKTILVLLPHMVYNALVAGGRPLGPEQHAMHLGWGKLCSHHNVSVKKAIQKNTKTLLLRGQSILPRFSLFRGVLETNPAKGKKGAYSS